MHYSSSNLTSIFKVILIFVLLFFVAELKADVSYGQCNGHASIGVPYFGYNAYAACINGTSTPGRQFVAFEQDPYTDPSVEIRGWCQLKYFSEYFGWRSGTAWCTLHHSSLCPTQLPNEWSDGTCHVDPESNPKQPTDECPKIGNPIIVATGNKHQTQTDYQSTKPFGLSFVRIYNSALPATNEGIGLKWRHNFSRKIEVTADTASAYRSNGQIFSFDGTNNWAGDVDIPDTLVELVDSSDVRTGWQYRDSNDNIETYNATGQLLTITNRAGQTQTLNYTLTTAEGGDDNPTTLDLIIGFYGEAMGFSYDSNQRITSMTDPHGRSYHYSYDSNGNLASVTYPPEGGSTPTRLYHYEDTNFPNHLTGITDEKGVRYVTWAYDTQGRAISSELAGGVDKSTLDFTNPDAVVTTNPLGKQTTYHFTTLHGVKKVTQVEGHATSNCAAANKAYSYDANGYLASKTDWKGNTTTYINNDRGLEISRTEASGTPEARTITTEWHPNFRLPTKITEPGKITEYSYDAQGRLLSTQINDLP